MTLCRIVLAAITIAVLATGARAEVQLSLVSIDATDRARVQQIADMGIDIWDVKMTQVTAAVTPEQMSRLRDEGFSYSVLFNTLEELHKAVSALPTPAVVSYRNHDQVVAEMQRTATEYPDLAKLCKIGTTYEGRPIWALKISEKVHLDRTVSRVLFCGEHHAREWISVEVPLRIADRITSTYATDPAMQRRLNQGEIWFVPMVNPDGYVYTWTTNRMWRKNRRPVGSGIYGVDVNRNYGYHWGETGASPNPQDETYRGPSAFSEKETQAIRDLMLSRRFHSVLSYHNYSQLVLWPWGYTTSPSPNASTFSYVGGNMASLIRGMYGVSYTPEQSSSLYITSGDTADWAYGAQGATAFSIELRPAGHPYFELPADQIVPTFEENLPAAMYLLDWTETYNPAIGIEVFTNRSTASFSITGPANYSGSGTHWLETEVSNGSYQITYSAVPGWITPPPASLYYS